MSGILCKAIKKDGSICKRYPIRGKEYCYAHIKLNDQNNFWLFLHNFFINNKKFIVMVSIIGLISAILDIPPNFTWIKENYFDRNSTIFPLKDTSLVTLTTVIVAGWVIEEGTGIPIKQAQIILPTSRDSGATNIDGYFRFLTHGKPFQQVDAIIRHPDYEYKIAGLTLSEDNRIILSKKR